MLILYPHLSMLIQWQSALNESNNFHIFVNKIRKEPKDDTFLIQLNIEGNFSQTTEL
jgi:hypothetical protein